MKPEKHNPRPAFHTGPKPKQSFHFTLPRAEAELLDEAVKAMISANPHMQEETHNWKSPDFPPPVESKQAREQALLKQLIRLAVCRVAAAFIRNPELFGWFEVELRPSTDAEKDHQIKSKWWCQAKKKPAVMDFLYPRYAKN